MGMQLAPDGFARGPRRALGRSMRTPSTGNAQPPQGSNDRQSDGDSATAEKPPNDRSRTHATTHGEPAPRLPHERDESSDSGTGGPSRTGQTAHDDAESAKEATDRSEASDAAYRDNLRGKTPGTERDTPDEGAGRRDR